MSSHVPLQGSQREHPANSTPAGNPVPDEIIQLTLILRRRSSAPDPDWCARHLSHRELANLYGADPADVQAIKEFVYQHQWSIVSINESARSVTISGRLGDLAGAFRADVALRQVGHQVLRTRQGSLHVPAS